MRLTRFNKLRNKLIIAFLLVAIIPLVLLTVISKNTTQDTLTKNANQSLLAIAQQTAFNIDNFMTTNLNNVRVESILPGLSKYLSLPPETRENSPEQKIALDILRSLNRRDNLNIYSYALLDLRGINVLDTYTPDIGQDESDKDYFKQPLKTGLPSVSNFRFSEKSPGLVHIYFSSPVRSSSGIVVGVLRVSYNATAIQLLITKQTGLAGENSFAMLLDENYVYLAHGLDYNLNFQAIVPLDNREIENLKQHGITPKPKDSPSPNLIKFKKILENYNQQPFGRIALPETDYKSNAIAISSLQNQPWLVVFVQPEDVFYAPITDQTRVSLFLALLMSGIVTIFAFIMGETLAKPIVTLTQLVADFTAGNHPIRVPIKSRDEIGILANTFNQMMERINSYTENLELKNAALSEAKSQLKESEIRLLKFLEALPLGIFVTDHEGHPYYANRIAIKLLKKGVIATVTAENLVEVYRLYRSHKNQLYSPEEFPIIKALKGEFSTVSDIEIHREDSVIPLELVGQPIFDENGNIVYAIAAFQDITERLKIEEERANWIDEIFKVNCDLELALESESNLTDAYGRFVPHQFLNLLGYETILDAKLGDQVQEEMSILFADIRDFTSLSEQMTPQENFRFINSFLKRMEPCITEHNGFIDKYIGDGLMALFSGNADDAVQAGIAMLNTLSEYNQYRESVGYQPIKIGVGINTGLLMLGTVGGENRMEGTVISDAVNLASRIEGLTKNYGVSLLITQQTYDKLTDPSSYAIRMIDIVKVKGKSLEVTVYEIFDADLPDVKENKLKTMDLFLEALFYFRQEQFTKSCPLFREYLTHNPHDSVAQIYLERCRECLI